MSRPLVAAACAALFATLTSFAALGAQVRDVPALTLEAAMAMADAAVTEAEANDWEVAIAIVDASGDLIVLRRMDGVQVGSIDIAMAKASTAARFRRETKALADAVAGGATTLLSVDGIIALEGGVPVQLDGATLGGIGVSGVASFQDAQIAKAGTAALRP
jgi:uncharacterized protein GlcG (DUF336 family)